MSISLPLVRRTNRAQIQPVKTVLETWLTAQTNKEI